MKRLIITLAVILSLNSCKKEDGNTVKCYECNLGQGYVDAGCMTKDEFNNTQFLDDNGFPIDKRNCR